MKTMVRLNLLLFAIASLFLSAIEAQEKSTTKRDPRVLSLKGRKGQGTIGESSVRFEFRANGNLLITGDLEGEGTWRQDGKTVRLETTVAVFKGTIEGDEVSGQRTWKEDDGSIVNWRASLFSTKAEGDWTYSISTAYEASQSGNFREAEALCLKAIRQAEQIEDNNSRVAKSYRMLALVFLKAKKYPEAEKAISKGLSIAETSEDVEAVDYCLATGAEVNRELGKGGEMLQLLIRRVKYAEENRRTNAGSIYGPYNLIAWFYATWPEKQFRNPRQAVEYAQKAATASKWKDSAILDTLAAAYASNGDFDSAIKWQAKAISLTSHENKKEYQSRLDLYRQGKPYRQEINDPELGRPVKAPSKVPSLPPLDF